VSPKANWEDTGINVVSGHNKYRSIKTYMIAMIMTQQAIPDNKLLMRIGISFDMLYVYDKR
jgi:hypothetical protein